MSSRESLSGETMFHTINQGPPSPLPFRLPADNWITLALLGQSFPNLIIHQNHLGNCKIQIWETYSRHTELGPKNQGFLFLGFFFFKLLPGIFFSYFEPGTDFGESQSS